MRQTIGIYCANDWAGARAYADALRADGQSVVRVRNGAAFTPDQLEPFDAVFVRGDFPAVMAAYPKAKRITEDGEQARPAPTAGEYQSPAALTPVKTEPVAEQAAVPAQAVSRDAGQKPTARGKK